MAIKSMELTEIESINPTDIIAPAIIAAFMSTLVAVVYCKVRDRRRRV